MNIFEQLDSLIDKTKNKTINESANNSDDGYYSVEIDEEHSTAEQALEIIRRKFLNKILRDREAAQGGGRDNSEGEDRDTDNLEVGTPVYNDIDDSSLPNPFQEEQGGGGNNNDGASVSDNTLVWDDDDFEQIRNRNNGESSPDIDSTRDNFDNDSGGGSGGSGQNDDEDDGDHDQDDNQDGDPGTNNNQNGQNGDNQDGENGDNQDGQGRNRNQNGPGGDPGTNFNNQDGENGENGDNQDGQGRNRNQNGPGGDPGTNNNQDGENGDNQDGENGNNQNNNNNRENNGAENDNNGSGSWDNGSDEALRNALDRIRNNADNNAERENLDDLINRLQNENNPSESISDTINDSNEDVEEMFGQMIDPISDEDLRREMEQHGYSEQDIQENIERKNDDVSLSDRQQEALRDRAIQELNDKCEGQSHLADSILYHSLKNAKLDDESWEKILERILKDKSKSIGEHSSTSKSPHWGNKNHLWRSAVLPGYKRKKGGDDTYKLCCFLDWYIVGGQQKEYMFSFLAKIIQMCEDLCFTDIDVYSFGRKLSLPRTINKEMVEKDGVKKVMEDTFAFIEKQNIGTGAENFKEIAEEIVQVKDEDQHAVFLIFGDGIWSFYGNPYPPIYLKHICDEFFDDIITFIYMYPAHKTDTGLHQRYLREISCLKDYVGLEHVIVSDMEKIKK